MKKLTTLLASGMINAFMMNVNNCNSCLGGMIIDLPAYETRQLSIDDQWFMIKKYHNRTEVSFSHYSLDETYTLIDFGPNNIADVKTIRKDRCKLIKETRSPTADDQQLFECVLEYLASEEN